MADEGVVAQHGSESESRSQSEPPLCLLCLCLCAVPEFAGETGVFLTFALVFAFVQMVFVFLVLVVHS